MYTATHNRNVGQPKYGNPYGNGATPYVQPQYHPHGQLYAQAQATHIQHENNGVSVDNLAQNFGNMNFRAAESGHSIGPGRLKENMVASNMVNINGMYGAQPSGQLYYPLPDGSLVLSSMSGASGNYQQYPTYGIPPTQSSHLQQPAYNGFPASASQMMPNTPQGQAWIPSQHLSRDVPGLVAPRRNSWSSSEETGPHTPLYSVPSQTGYQPTAVFNEQSSSWSTPSPQQIDQSQFIGKADNGHYTFMDFSALAKKDPEIPLAVPAPLSPNDGRGTLDKILDNPWKTTNVYIRGLPPNTTDDMLKQYGARFGDIDTAKSIIDHPTDLCKGYGFIKYHNYVAAENCIRGFFHRGYEAKFAKQSHNARLKNLGRKDNTNLYVSNLPNEMNDAELAAIFTSVNPEFRVESQKILRDSNGMSRGVGFARFETPEICEKVIASFHGKTIGEGKNASILQLRYADTKEQKMLKMETAERRQFKANEYNIAVSLPDSPYRFLSPASGVFPSPLQIRNLAPNGMWMNQSPVSPASADCYSFWQPSVAQEARSFPVQAAAKVHISAPPTAARYASRVKIEPPSLGADVATKKASEKDSVVVDTPPDSDEEGTSCKATASDTVESPTKSKL